MKDGREGARLKIEEIGINAIFILPKCPASIGIEGGGAIPIKTLSSSVLTKIADEWRRELFRKACELPLKEQVLGSDDET